jgi:glycosyltransferase involved in cell wall biosynthesis
MNISVIIPLLNEDESLKELHTWITSVMKVHQYSYEILFIDDGSTDKSWDVIRSLSKENKQVKGYKFSQNYGKSQALHLGFAEAKGDVVITMDADLQDNPEEIPELYDLIIKEDFDLISGWKKKRYDAVFAKNLPSKLFNWCARKTSGLKLHDFNCGLKAYKNKVVKNVDVYGEMHRYIPVLAKNAGFKKIDEKIVQHQARKYGKTKFGMDRFINGFLDLLTISFLSKFGKQPMHLFGALGTLLFIVGFLFAFYLGIDKLLLNPRERLITERPQFYISLASMIIGSQFFIAGFLGELTLRNKKNQERYTLEDKIENNEF